MLKNTIPIVIIFSFFIFACKKEKISSLNTSATTIDYKQQNIPDFSFSGYKRSEVPIPFIPEKITLTPGSENDRENIQTAINELAKQPLVGGFRGAILLKAGTYYIDNTIYISASGIVIRGEGQGDKGTILIATRKGVDIPASINERKQQSVFTLIGAESGYVKTGAESRIENNFVNVGDKSIEIQNSSGFNVGDTIMVVKTTNEQWISNLKAASYGWDSKTYQINHIRVINGIDKNNISFEIPMVDQIKSDEGGGKIMSVSFPGRISNSGIENMRLESVYSNDEDELHTWSAVRLVGVENCWVRNITAKYFAYTAVSLHAQSDFNTIQDCAMLEPKSQPIGNRRYAFNIDLGTGNLFQRCYSDNGRHDFVTGSRVSGPNVFLDGFAVNSIDETGPHHRWATGTLYDNIHAGRISARNREATGGGQGWTGAFNMFWNCEATKGFRIDNPPGSINWIIGGQGSSNVGTGYTASFGLRVDPRSIFIDQLTKRIGLAKTQQIITPEQSNNSVWIDLKKWAGNQMPLKAIGMNP